MENKYEKKIKALTGDKFNSSALDAAIKGIEAVIQLSGETAPDREGLEDTPHRVVKMFLEYTEGYHENPRDHLKKQFQVDSEDLILIKDIQFVSLCEHHFAPFTGVAHVAYIPGRHPETHKPIITGLSKIARMVQGYAKRFQVQENLTREIADAMEQELNAKGVVVVIEAMHTCMCYRGIKAIGASTITSSMRGVFNVSESARAEVMSLITAPSRISK